MRRASMRQRGCALAVIIATCALAVATCALVWWALPYTGELGITLILVAVLAGLHAR